MAIENYQKAIKLSQSFNWTAGEAYAAWCLGEIYEADNPDQAVELMSVEVAYKQSIGHQDAEKHSIRVEEIKVRINQMT
ncbi:MAG: hypothetical protein GY796_11270 [Chloroflexi bacterium]|nr:hypothetical protein [Chloroflexota bacterium]